MVTFLILGTRQGVITARKQGNRWVETSRGLEGRRVTSVAVSGGQIYSGTTEGLYRSSIDVTGESDPEAALSKLEWEPLREGIGPVHIRYLASFPGKDKRVLAGVEPAEIYITTDGGDTWRNCPEVATLRARHGWSLPYSPEAGCVRGFAFHGGQAYAAVEDGCVLISGNSGETWRVAEGSSGGPDHSPSIGYVHSDVHSIEVHPSSADRVLAPTGGGLYHSQDGGVTWSSLYRCYTRAAWLDPQEPEHIVFGPADSVDRGGRIEVTQDGGQSWTNASQGLETPWRNHMVERFVQIGKYLLAVLSNGQLLAAPLDTMVWEYLLPDAPFALSAAGLVVGE